MPKGSTQVNTFAHWEPGLRTEVRRDRFYPPDLAPSSSGRGNFNQISVYLSKYYKGRECLIVINFRENVFIILMLLGQLAEAVKSVLKS